jgi:membrane fusion protein (multidrug efflux system)
MRISNFKYHSIQFRQDMKTYIGNIIKANSNLKTLPEAFRKSIPRGTVVATLLATGIAALSSCGGSPAPTAGMRPPRATVTVYTANPAVYTVTEKFAATLMANSVVQLRPDVTGYLEAIRVKDGSDVRKGQPLYDIDKSRYQAAYNQAQASLQQAKADLAQKQRDLKRYQDLLQHDAIAQQVADQAATAVKTSQANMAAAQASLAKAATDLNHAVLHAPISGKIGIAQVKIGDIINAGQTLVNTIVNDNPIYADFNVPQSDYRFFGKKSSDIKYHLQLADSSKYNEPGKLLVINNVVDPTTGTIQIRLEFPNTKGLLKSGMNAVVLVSHPSDSNTMAIPTKALIQTLAETSVYTVGSGNVIQSKPVVPGSQLDSLTLVKGLQPGEKVVINGLQKARPGDTVNVMTDTTNGTR